MVQSEKAIDQNSPTNSFSINSVFGLAKSEKLLFHMELGNFIDY